LDARGYFAIADGSWLEFVFGLGADGVTARLGNEVHSTFGGVVNNYGLVGLILFMVPIVWWLAILRDAFGLKGVAYIAGPSLLYGLTHNGIRFTPFWLLYSASIVASSLRFQEERVVRVGQVASGPLAMR
jgi:hypothetical protein